MLNLDFLLSDNSRKHHQLIVFIRHAEKQPAINDPTEASVSITTQGALQAKMFGQQLKKLRRTVKLISSPLKRCQETALAIQSEFDSPTGIDSSNLLGDPGAYIENTTSAGPVFNTLGAYGVVNNQLANIGLNGIRDHSSGTSLLIHFLNKQFFKENVLVVVSHDAIIATFIGSLLNKSEITQAEYVQFLDGCCLSYDGESQYNLNWLGKSYDISTRFSQLLSLNSHDLPTPSYRPR